MLYITVGRAEDPVEGVIDEESNGIGGEVNALPVIEIWEIGGPDFIDETLP